MAQSSRSKRTINPYSQALRDNRGNKTYQSGLTCWVDWLLPFSFTEKHIVRKNMEFAVFFSRHQTSKTIPPSKENDNFVINLIDRFKFFLKRADEISAYKNTDTLFERNGVINAKQHKQIEQHFFSHSLCTNLSHHSVPNLKNISLHKSIVNVCSRNKPRKITLNNRSPKNSEARTKKWTRPIIQTIPPK